MPIAGIAGDQQAALFGQACFREGDAKCTYGTGAFALMNIGERPILERSRSRDDRGMEHRRQDHVCARGERLHRRRRGAVAARRPRAHQERQRHRGARPARAVERRRGRSFRRSRGSGAPHWDPEARGNITGITRGNDVGAPRARDARGHRVRGPRPARRDGQRREAAPRAPAGRRGRGRELPAHAVPGRHRRTWSVERPADVESTGRGAAMLAGLGAGLYRSLDDVAPLSGTDTRFEPHMSAEDRSANLARWSSALAMTRGGGKPASGVGKS